MKIFIDTARIDEIEKAVSMGVCDGVTTNPTLLAKVEGSAEDIYKDICKAVNGPVCAETVGVTADEIVKEGEELSNIAKNIVVKIPCTKEGLLAVKQLEENGIPTNVTLVFSPMQALLAAKAGASYVCPFVGRLDDIGNTGMELVEQILQIYNNYDIPTEIIVASIRGTLHVEQSALLGAHIATIPFNVIEKMVQHPLTDIGVHRFLDDWVKVKDRM